MRQSQNSQLKNGAVEIGHQDFQLFTRLKKMIDACVKMECLGCHQLVPTVQFYDHLIDSDFDESTQQPHRFCNENCEQISDFNNETKATYPGITGSAQQPRGQPFDHRSRSVGRKPYGGVLAGSRQFLNQSAELTDELGASSQFKQKYLNALSIINQYQAHIAQLKTIIAEHQDLIQQMENNEAAQE